MKKIAILKCTEYDCGYATQVKVIEQDCYELEDDEVTFVMNNISRVTDYHNHIIYKVVEFCPPVIQEDATDILSKLRQLKAADDERQARYNRERAKDAEKRAATSIERKRRQLEKLKKELGDG